jgi:hypothetical protein
MKKDAYYFSHDANSQDDPKCMVLIDQLGMEGYGIFWALIEKLRSEKDYKLPISVCNSFAKRWGTSKEKVEAVVLKFNLFCIENDLIFFSERLKTSMEMKSASARKSVNKRWENTNVLQSNTDVIRIDTIKVKESKVKKRKVYKEIIYPTLDECIKYFTDNGYSDKSGSTAWYYYDSAKWHDRNGDKVINWKQKMRGVWFKEEHKNKLLLPKQMIR